jgi:hypothetical protein
MLLATLLAAACTDVPAAPEDTEILLSVQSGDDQVWIAGYELPDALVVKVTGVRDRPVPHFQVNFRVIEGGGSMYAGSGHTDPHGIARDYWTLGPEPGENVVEVRSVQPTTGEKQVWARFTATGKPWPPQLTTVRHLLVDGFVDALIERLEPDVADELRSALSQLLEGLGEELDLDQVGEALAAAHSLVEGAAPPNTVEYAFLDLILGRCEVLFDEAILALSG